MYIDVIDSFERFAQLKPDWERVYEADPEAQFFLSWTWLSRWLEGMKRGWFILAAKPAAGASPYVAFLPLRLRPGTTKGGRPYTEITMAGRRAADYTGLISVPDHQQNAIPAFATHVIPRLREDDSRGGFPWR